MQAITRSKTPYNGKCAKTNGIASKIFLIIIKVLYTTPPIKKRI
jgi:hypothetical protein